MSESCDFNMATSKSLPKDAQVILSIMKELGINDHEPRVINQLLEFTYRYVTGILDDARLYANHARKKALDVEDIKLAIQLKMDRMFTNPPPRDILLEIARVKNSSPLPVIKPHCGVRLPPDRYCLAQCNYKLKSMSAKKPIKPLSTFQSSSSLGKSGARPPQTPTMKKPPQGPTIKIAPKPIVKVASGADELQTLKDPSSSTTSAQGSSEDVVVKMETDEIIETVVVKQEDL
nr:PREDICTED: transcription initiation factor TFIID subunit 9 [Bemisia tabaci]